MGSVGGRTIEGAFIKNGGGGRKEIRRTREDRRGGRAGARESAPVLLTLRLHGRLLEGILMTEQIIRVRS